MAEILNFPDNGSRSWVVFEKGLRAFMADMGYSGDQISHVLETLRPAFQEVYSTAALPINEVPPDDAVRLVNEWVYRVVMGLLIAMADLAAENYTLRKGRT